MIGSVQEAAAPWRNLDPAHRRPTRKGAKILEEVFAVGAFWAVLRSRFWRLAIWPPLSECGILREEKMLPLTVSPLWRLHTKLETRSRWPKFFFFQLIAISCRPAPPQAL